MTQPEAPPHRHSRGAGSLVRLVIAAALLFTIWYTWPTAASPDLLEVARQPAEQAFPGIELGPSVSQTGRFGSYQLTFRGQRDEQTATVFVYISVTPEGPRVTGSKVILGSASNAPLRLAQLAMAMAIVMLVLFGAIPRIFGRKCPRDGSLLKLDDATIVPWQYDTKLLARPPIIQRTWACRRCDFRHVAALPDPKYRPAVYSNFNHSHQWEQMMSQRREEAVARGVTDEQYAEMLKQARLRAAEATSRDSPWPR
ncbi:MAG: hypothetical protein Q8P31_13485 [Bacillota bacterium]|nr:hypothetical protein [Bacillota bacterium]